MADKDGAAGSAAFQTDGSSSVIGVAVSAAVGKQDAFAGAFNDSVNGNNTAFAPESLTQVAQKQAEKGKG